MKSWTNSCPHAKLHPHSLQFDRSNLREIMKMRQSRIIFLSDRILMLSQYDMIWLLNVVYFTRNTKGERSNLFKAFKGFQLIQNKKDKGDLLINRSVYCDTDRWVQVSTHWYFNLCFYVFFPYASPATLKHILVGCKTSLTQGRYT